MSRILWGLGYHQPPIYYLPSWTLERDGDTAARERSAVPAEAAALNRLTEYWRWQQNPFVGAHEFSGLLVVMLMFNSTDLKDDNNSIYKLTEPWEGAAAGSWCAIVGAALGETGKLYPRRNWLEGFEKHAFHDRADGDRRAVRLSRAPPGTALDDSRPPTSAGRPSGCSG